MIRSARLLVLALLLIALMPGCPLPPSFFGVWDYRDCDGALYASVVIHEDGSMEMYTAGGDGLGSWTRTGDDFGFTVTVNSSPSALVIFSGTVIDEARIEGAAQSDQPPTELCVVMLRSPFKD